PPDQLLAHAETVEAEPVDRPTCQVPVSDWKLATSVRPSPLKSATRLAVQPAALPRLAQRWRVKPVPVERLTHHVPSPALKLTMSALPSWFTSPVACVVQRPWTSTVNCRVVVARPSEALTSTVTAPSPPA